jgi:hypothetical protein
MVLSIGILSEDKNPWRESKYNRQQVAVLCQLTPALQYNYRHLIGTVTRTKRNDLYVSRD